MTVFQSSGNSILDRAARAALFDARFMPLPGEYPNPALTIRLSFPYGPQ
jgi:outer membrane biosynthesis protein TonB